MWIETAGCACVEVPAHVPDFQLDIDALAAAIGPKTSAVIINTPNNPVGAVYSRANLEALAKLLTEKEAELGRELFLISDEPYREIVYEGIEVPYVPSLYARTIVCYSYSKSLSLPGERIGYVFVSDAMDDADRVFAAVAGAGRALGYICAPVLFQRVIAACVDQPSDVEAYAENRKLLTDGLSALGYEYVEPQGAFYLWVRALEDDAQAFSDRAKEHELLIVPSDSSAWAAGAHQLLHRARNHREAACRRSSAHGVVSRLGPVVQLGEASACQGFFDAGECRRVPLASKRSGACFVFRSSWGRSGARIRLGAAPLLTAVPAAGLRLRDGWPSWWRSGRRCGRRACAPRSRTTHVRPGAPSSRRPG